MSGSKDRPCRQCDSRGTRTNKWRACPKPSCGLEIGYCDPHGGDARAVKEMEEHITREHKSPVYALDVHIVHIDRATGEPLYHPKAVQEGKELEHQGLTSEGMMLMFHDDSCGELLDSSGKCPRCGFHPDMQSTGFKPVPHAEIDKRRSVGATFMTLRRTPVS